MRLSVLAAAAAAAWLGVAPAAGAAEFAVGSGSSLDLGTGRLGLGCADLTVGGTLSAGTIGLDAARDVSIGASGVVNGESATLEVAGDWNNAGTFNAGSRPSRLNGSGHAAGTPCPGIPYMRRAR